MAADINAARLKALARTAQRQGVLSMLRLCVGDMASLQTSHSPTTNPRDAKQKCDPADVASMCFDVVLVDAPCSGSGVLAKRADLRWRRTPGQLHDLIQLQARLLDRLAPLVQPGGVLVYSTCSVLGVENEEQVASFLERHPEFVVDAPPAGVPKEVCTADGFMATLPHVHNCDGAFAARLLRK